MLTLDDLDEAQRVLTSLLESSPRSLPVLELQCRMHLMQDDFIAAQSAIKALHELSPETLPRLYALIWLCTGLSPLLAGQSLSHYVQPFIRNSSNSVWEKSDRVAFITWVMLQQPEYAQQPVDTVWAMLFKGKKGKFNYQICNIFIKVNESNFILAKTEIYGDSLVNQRFCKSFSLIENIKLLQQ